MVDNHINARYNNSIIWFLSIFTIQRKEVNKMNAALFKYYMVKNCETMSTLAAALGKCKVTVSNCVNGNAKSEFNRMDIKILKERWKLTPEQVDKVFLQTDAEPEN